MSTTVLFRNVGGRQVAIQGPLAACRARQHGDYRCRNVTGDRSALSGHGWSPRRARSRRSCCRLRLSSDGRHLGLRLALRGVAPDHLAALAQLQPDPGRRLAPPARPAGRAARRSAPRAPAAPTGWSGRPARASPAAPAAGRAGRCVHRVVAPRPSPSISSERRRRCGTAATGGALHHLDHAASRGQSRLTVDPVDRRQRRPPGRATASRSTRASGVSGGDRGGRAHLLRR